MPSSRVNCFKAVTIFCLAIFCQIGQKNLGTKILTRDYMKLQRRMFLRSTGIALALPWLNAFGDDAKEAKVGRVPRRMICICAPLGLHPDNFFPTKAGKDYELSPYLDVLKDYRSDFTVISGLSHAGMGSSFCASSLSQLSDGAPGAGRPGFRNTISLDQFAADTIGTQTRYPSLVYPGRLWWTFLDAHRCFDRCGQFAI